LDPTGEPRRLLPIPTVATALPVPVIEHGPVIGWRKNQ
jgi:hypothetical protein